MSIQVTKDKNALACLRRTMQSAWWGDSNAKKFAQPPTILNGEFVTAVNAANSAVVNIIGVDTNNNVVFGDGSTVSSAIVSLSAAQIIAMGPTPISVVAAPGAGKVVIFNRVLFEMTTTSTQFTGGAAVHFYYHGGTVDAPTGAVAAAVVTTTAGTSNTLLGPSAAATGIALPANTGVDITTLANAAFAAGTGTAKIQIWYSIVTL